MKMNATAKGALTTLAYGFLSPAVSVWFCMVICVILPVLALFVISGKVEFDFTDIRNGVFCFYKFGIVPGLCAGLYVAQQFKRHQPINLVMYYGLHAIVLIIVMLYTGALVRGWDNLAGAFMITVAVMLNAFFFLRIVKRRCAPPSLSLSPEA